MIKNWFLTGFVLKVLIVLCLTLTVYSSEVRATGSPSDSIINTHNTTPIPYRVNEDAGDPGGQINAQGDITNKPGNDETWIARPGDPEPEYPADRCKI